MGSDGTELLAVALCPGLSGVPHYGLRWNLCRAGAEHQRGQRCKRRALDMYRVHSAAVLHPLQVQLRRQVHFQRALIRNGRDGNEKEKHKLESKTTKEVPDAAQAEAPASGKSESDRETASCLVRALQKRRIKITDLAKTISAKIEYLKELIKTLKHDMTEIKEQKEKQKQENKIKVAEKSIGYLGETSKHLYEIANRIPKEKRDPQNV